MLNDFYDKYEKRLEYVGSSAIEDKLQDLVPETIATLIETNIRVWVLTGDKQETAIEIGKSCQLIQNDMRQIILSSDSQEQLLEKLTIEIQRIKVDIQKTPTELNTDLKALLRANPNHEINKMSVIIDGKTLTYVLESQEIAQ